MIEEGIAPEEALKLIYCHLIMILLQILIVQLILINLTQYLLLGVQLQSFSKYQRPKIVSIKKVEKQRRIFLKYDEVQKLWNLPLKPCFEYRNRDLKNLDDAKGIYRLAFNGNDIQYIGETNNLSRRYINIIKNDEIKFDEIQYSVLEQSK